MSRNLAQGNCDYCLKRDLPVTKQVNLRQTDNLWTERGYRLCSDCRRHMIGNFRYVYPLVK